MNYRIIAIRKPGGAHNASESISHYRWVPDGSGIAYDVERQVAIDTLRSTNSNAYVQVGNNHSWCGIRSNGRIEFLQTYSDNTWNDNLLSLPEF